MKSKYLIFLGLCLMVVTGCGKGKKATTAPMATEQKAQSQNSSISETKDQPVQYTLKSGKTLTPLSIITDEGFVYALVVGDGGEDFSILHLAIRRELGSYLRTSVSKKVMRHPAMTAVSPTKNAIRAQSMVISFDDELCTSKTTYSAMPIGNDGQVCEWTETRSPIIPEDVYENVYEGKDGHGQTYAVGRISASFTYDDPYLAYPHFPDGDKPFVLPFLTIGGVGEVEEAGNGNIYTLGWGKRGDNAFVDATGACHSQFLEWVGKNPGKTVVLGDELAKDQIIGWKLDGYGNLLVLASVSVKEGKR